MVSPDVFKWEKTVCHSHLIPSAELLLSEKLFSGTGTSGSNDAVQSVVQSAACLIHVYAFGCQAEEFKWPGTDLAHLLMASVNAISPIQVGSEESFAQDRAKINKLMIQVEIIQGN